MHLESKFSFLVDLRLYERSHHSTSMCVGRVWPTLWEPVNSKCGVQTDIVPLRRERDVWVDERYFVWTGFIQMHYLSALCGISTGWKCLCPALLHLLWALHSCLCPNVYRWYIICLHYLARLRYKLYGETVLLRMLRSPRS